MAMSHRPETTWERGAPSQITLNSIFAALDAALIVIIIPDPQSSMWKLWSLLLLVLSFCFFAVSAEKTVVALEERDVKKYAYYLLSYNLGVICTGVAIELMLYDRYGFDLRWRLNSYLGSCSGWISRLLWVFVAFAFLRIWICDFCWLFLANRRDFDHWLGELDDKHDPAEDRTPLMRAFYSVRERFHG
jgi:hypothetical protein